MTVINFKSVRVLIVDDEQFIRELIGRALRDFGIGKIYFAADGREALEKVVTLSGSLDIIICDLEMPGMDGFAFVDQLRHLSDAKASALPVLILTGHAQQGNIETAVKLGIHGFLTKPVSIKDLTVRMEKALTSPPIDPARLKKKI